MKRAFVLFGLLFFVNSICLAQQTGNRIYGNQGYAQNRRTPVFGDGNLMSSGNGNFQIEASVLVNLKPDSFVVVFGVAQEARNAAESNDKVNLQIDKFVSNLAALGITRNEVYIDFITQNKVYDFAVKEEVAEQFLTGFETKKTVAVKYKARESFEKILAAATNSQIFDLIKVDYIVSDFESVKERLFGEATQVIKKKEARYRTIFDMTIKSVGLAVEKYDAFYPAERYENYHAFESGAAQSSHRDGKTLVYLRKGSTFFYEPIGGNKFDKILNPVGIEPTVQFTVYLQVQYRLI